MKKRKRNVKFRGSRTCGWGSTKKHRGGGSRGGRGLGGVKKQKKFHVTKYMPGHIGKRGFKSLGQRRIKPSVRAINLRDLVKISDKKEIDLKEFGYDKVLGTGTLEKALNVKARFFTKAAEEKITKAGGKVVKYAEAEVSEEVS